MQTILNRFLAASLLPIGDDDEKLHLLERAATELATRIQATPILAHRLVLVGLDQNALATDPAFAPVAAAVTAQWQTITNRVGAEPVQLYRAVILRALQCVAAERVQLGHAILLLAHDRPTRDIERSVAAPVEAMLADIQRDVFDELNQTWVTPIQLSLPKPSAKSKAATGIKEDLLLGLSGAVGPTDKSGRQLSNPNPHWPTAGQDWTVEFVIRTADVLHNALQKMAKSLAESMQEPFKEALTEWSDALQRLAIRDAKAELLWIRASLYSPSAGTGYRDLSPHDVVLHAALDTSRAVAANAPPSVESFLRELVASLVQDSSRLAILLEAIGPKLAALPEGRSIIDTEQLPAKGRRGWLDFAVRRTEIPSQFETETGVPTEFEDNLAEIAVQLYRELQVRKLLANWV